MDYSSKTVVGGVRTHNINIFIAAKIPNDKIPLGLKRGLKPSYKGHVV
jgi:hypothetical protein